MSILQRFKTVMSSNLNALLEKHKNPVKAIDQYYRDFTRELATIKSELATVVMEEQRANRALLECQSDITKMHRYAEKALANENEEQARFFLEKKVQLLAQEKSLQQKYDMTKEAAEKVRQMEEKRMSDLQELEIRRTALKEKANLANSSASINEIDSKLKDIENEVDRSMYEAEALAELQKDPFDFKEGEPTLHSSNSTPSAEEELQKLKKQLNQK
ncbi:PspA/IM30 family protein [Bacillus alkalicellulosilyticus]|uniref:PspA/IM30 family protein n=1 Tax=Alkalihalobacterium alkalicellulosilyticum TaxID=1912214 RepID=UPI00099727DF|nr:PspA/IM30 family protein [Bacillus alkalicellulosilyticus]